MPQKICDPSHKSPLWQLDEKGVEIQLPSNWVLCSVGDHEEDILSELSADRMDVRSKGLFRHIRQNGMEVRLKSILEKTRSNTLRVDVGLQKRNQRREMQKDADKTHTGEARWTNVGSDGVEFMSSHNAVVGWFGVYSPLYKKEHSMVRKSQELCEWGMRWDMVPPLCRPDNIEEKSTEVRQQQQTTSSSSQDELEDVNAESMDEPDWT